jgi:isoleucyl-tRNA synthetase
MAVRREVTKALEIARRDKLIGHALNAAVTLGLSPRLMEALRPYQDQLRSIFIVSSVELLEPDQLQDVPESETLPGVKVAVTASPHEKCERCWVHDATVGHEATHPTICSRCLRAMSEMESMDD